MKYNQLLFQMSQGTQQLKEQYSSQPQMTMGNSQVFMPPPIEQQYQTNQNLDLPPSHLQWQSIPQNYSQANNANSQEDTRTTPLVNFQISTMGDDEGGLTERGASIHLQKVQQSNETLE